MSLRLLLHGRHKPKHLGFTPPGQTRASDSTCFPKLATPAAYILPSKHTLEGASDKIGSSSGVPRVTRPLHCAHVPHGSPKSRRPIPGPPRRVGRPPVVFPSPTANLSCQRPRHNSSPAGKVCPGEGEHRHSAASSPQIIPETGQAPRLLTAEERTASPKRTPAGAPHKALESAREGTYPARSSETEGALERLPSLFRHHYLYPPTCYTSPQGQKAGGTSLPAVGPPLPPPPRMVGRAFPLKWGVWKQDLSPAPRAGPNSRPAFYLCSATPPLCLASPELLTDRQRGSVWICLFHLIITLTGKLSNLPVRLGS